jgi:hypothetical protein
MRLPERVPMPEKRPNMTDDSIYGMLDGLIDENLSLSEADRKLAHGRLEEWIKTYQACVKLGISAPAAA